MVGGKEIVGRKLEKRIWVRKRVAAGLEMDIKMSIRLISTKIKPKTMMKRKMETPTTTKTMTDYWKQKMMRKSQYQRPFLKDAFYSYRWG